MNQTYYMYGIETATKPSSYFVFIHGTPPKQMRPPFGVLCHSQWIATLLNFIPELHHFIYLISEPEVFASSHSVIDRSVYILHLGLTHRLRVRSRFYMVIFQRPKARRTMCRGIYYARSALCPFPLVIELHYRTHFPFIFYVALE